MAKMYWEVSGKISERDLNNVVVTRSIKFLVETAHDAVINEALHGAAACLSGSDGVNDYRISSVKRTQFSRLLDAGGNGLYAVRSEVQDVDLIKERVLVQADSIDQATKAVRRDVEDVVVKSTALTSYEFVAKCLEGGAE